MPGMSIFFAKKANAAPVFYSINMNCLTIEYLKEKGFIEKLNFPYAPKVKMYSLDFSDKIWGVNTHTFRCLYENDQPIFLVYLVNDRGASNNIYSQERFESLYDLLTKSFD